MRFGIQVVLNSLKFASKRPLEAHSYSASGAFARHSSFHDGSHREKNFYEAGSLRKESFQLREK